MWKYILKRLIMVIPVLIGVAIIIFTVLYFTPGDPVSLMIGTNATPEQYNAKLVELGLDRPYIVQLGDFLKQLFIDFDLGTSYVYSTNVMHDLFMRLPRTAMIALICMIMQIVLAIPLGITAATHQNGWQDRFCILLAMISVSIPGFWLAMLLVLLFALQLNWLPSHGIDSWYSYILPCLAGGLHGVGGMARLTRSQMLEVIRSDYVLTARSKGVSERSILYNHALPNALIPVITGTGIHFGSALGGTVIIESVFSIPGVGLYMIEAIGNRDYPAVRGGVTLLALLFCLVVLLVDLLYAFIDPRVKAQYEGQQRKRVKKHA